MPCLNLLSAWDAIGNPKILVLGDIILDRYTWGNAERVSPEAPVLVLKVDTHEVRLGGAASVAGILRALDAEVTLAGVIGNDTNGRVVRRLLEEAGIESGLVLCDECRPTTTKQRFIGRADGKHPHQVLRVDEECSRLLSEDVQRHLAERISNRLAEFDAVLVSDYAKGVCRSDCSKTTYHYAGVGTFPDLTQSDHQESPLPSDEFKVTIETAPDKTVLLTTVIRAANEDGIPVLVDPARIQDVECYRGATLLKPNRVEAELSARFKIDTPQAAMRAGEALCKRLGLQAAVITLDRDGMVLSQRDEPSEVFPTVPRAVCDITGAGDMAFAVLGLALAACQAEQSTTNDFRNALPNAVRLANIASGLEVERFGVAPLSRREISEEILRNAGVSFSKLTNLEQMQSIAERRRREGKTIVFTNGCFDLLHVGHLTMLEQSSRLGDVLVVAINSDASVRQLKGPGRPVVGQAARAAMLGGLECVDHVLIFDDATPHRLLTAIRPDILVKGGTTADIVGREVVEGYGGRIEWTSEIPGHSTTELLTQIQSSGLRPSGSGFRIPQTKPPFSTLTNPLEEPVADARGSDLVPQGSSIALSKEIH